MGKGQRPARRSIDWGGSAFRRQFNAAFIGDDGRPRIGWFVAICSQIVVLGHLGTTWHKLIELPETLLIVLAFLIAPDIIKRALALKLGTGK